MTLETPQRAVELGVAFLDEHDPDWADRIHPANLDLWSPTCCILGQLYGDYTFGLRRYGLDDDDGIRFGLNVPLAAAQQRMAELRDAWCEVVDARQAVSQRERELVTSA